MRSIVIFGGTDAYGPTKKQDLKFAYELGLSFAKHFHQIKIYTGGTKGFPREFGKGFCAGMVSESNQSVNHILPTRFEKTYDHNPDKYHRGQEKAKYTFEGRNMEERRTFIASIPVDFAIAMGGGPGTVDEVEKALKNGTEVIFLVRAGGACAPKKFDKITMKKHPSRKHFSIVANQKKGPHLYS